MVASHLDKGLVELEAGGGEGIEVGSVHGRGGDKRPINLVVGYSVPELENVADMVDLSV